MAVIRFSHWQQLKIFLNELFNATEPAVLFFNDQILQAYSTEFCWMNSCYFIIMYLVLQLCYQYMQKFPNQESYND